MWQALDGGQVHRLSERQIKEMIATGEVPWGDLSANTSVHLGKQYHRCMSDIKRCQEEILSLQVERTRLRAWLEDTSSRVQKALISEPVNTGRAILLNRHLTWLKEMLSKMLEVPIV